MRTALTSVLRLESHSLYEAWRNAMLTLPASLSVKNPFAEVISIAAFIVLGT